MDERKEIKIVVPGDQNMTDILGHRDELLKIIEKSFSCDIFVRGNEITVTGEAEEAKVVVEIFEELIELVNRGQDLTKQSISETVQIISGREAVKPSKILGDALVVHKGRAIYPKTKNQYRYVNAVENNTLVFVIGPAGTGKTYLAMALAVKALKSKQVSRIILTRPVVEAGEKLGFLPGDIFQKVDPYLRPLFDALYDMMDPEQFQRFMDKGIIEIAPLAYMRGRTLNDSFIILDEAQNTTPEQLKMFLTRLGFGSKIIVTGDITQIDLPKEKKSGLLHVGPILKGIGNIAFIDLTERDVVRHELIQKIVKAYDEHAEKPEIKGRGVSTA